MLLCKRKSENYLQERLQDELVKRGSCPLCKQPVYPKIGLGGKLLIGAYLAGMSYLCCKALKRNRELRNELSKS